MRIRNVRSLVLVLFICLLLVGCEKKNPATSTIPANPTQADLGMPIYPNSKLEGKITKAVHGNETLITGLFTTPDKFRQVLDFYTKEAKKNGNYSSHFSTNGTRETATSGSGEFNIQTKSSSISVKIDSPIGAPTEVIITRTI